MWFWTVLAIVGSFLALRFGGFGLMFGLQVVLFIALWVKTARRGPRWRTVEKD